MTDSNTDAPRGVLPIVIAGHVDHGKSTLIGRLLHDTGSLPDGKVEAIEAMIDQRGMGFEWAFAVDAFQAERDQGITIDTTQIHFRTAKRGYVIIDAPGHKEFLKNMVTGAAQAEAALLVIDAAEGIREQTRRHAYLLRLLGLDQVAVVVNKMDCVAYRQADFDSISREITAYLSEIGLAPIAVVPVVARNGDNIARRSELMPWYAGPTVVAVLDGFEKPPAAADQPLRLPVQDVYRFDDRRVVVGRIESGRLRVGDMLEFAPTGKRARVARLESWNAKAPQISAAAGQSVAITLDDDLFVERGQLAHAPDDAPHSAHYLKVRIFWLAKTPLKAGAQLVFRLGTASHKVKVAAIETAIDVETLARTAADAVPPGGVGEVVLHSRTPIVADSFHDNPRTGRGVLQDGHDIVGGGVVIDRVAVARQNNLFAVDHAVSTGARVQANGHKPGVLWMTGLSGAGKSTLAMAVEQTLFTRGFQVIVLDGDNLRHGLNGDLGFSPDDRGENIRRAAEVAKLLAEAGFIVIASFISPYRADRERGRDVAGDLFHEVYVKAGLATCEARDPKGLYAMARAGQITQFTGIDAPYEAPEAADLVLDTETGSIEARARDLLEYAERAFAIEPESRRGAA